MYHGTDGHYGTSEKKLNKCKKHYIDQIKWLH